MDSELTIHETTVSDKYLDVCIKHRTSLGIVNHPLSEVDDCPDLSCSVGCPFNLHEKEVQNEKDVGVV